MTAGQKWSVPAVNDRLTKLPALEMPVPMWNKPYDPKEMRYLWEETALLLSETELMPVDGNRFWEYGRVLNFCSHHLACPCQVLDVGGAGSTLPAAITCLGHTVIVLDINPEGASKVADLRSAGYDRVFWRYGRAEDLPFPDGVFDCVACISVLEHLSDDRPALKEMVRVLKPKGYLVLSFDFVKEARAPSRHQLHLYSEAEVLDLIGWLDMQGLEPVEPYDYSYAGEHIHCYGDHDSVCNGAMLICQKS